MKPGERWVYRWMLFSAVGLALVQINRIVHGEPSGVLAWAAAVVLIGYPVVVLAFYVWKIRQTKTDDS